LGAYSVAGVPAAALGARTLLVLPSHIVDVALGLFFLAMVPSRRRQVARPKRFELLTPSFVVCYCCGLVFRRNMRHPDDRAAWRSDLTQGPPP
jgi:uncharacterized protein